MKNLYRLLVLLIIIKSSFLTFAQDPKISWELEGEQPNSTFNYLARDYVTLKNNFTYKATGTNTFTAKIDQLLVFPPTEATYAIQNTDGTMTVTTDATKGSVVGAIPGQFNVSPTGAATYTIPIEVPAGINGMQPNLSLVYNSQAGNGIAGWGWNIGGLSMIKRVPKNNFEDNQNSSILWTNDCPLELDGVRLVKNSQWGNDSIEYRTSNESFSQIIAIDIKNWGPRYFKVYYKNGNIGYYGETENSTYLLNKSKLGSYYNLGWCLARVIDRNGNKIELEYASESQDTFLSLGKIFSDFRIVSIKYGSNTKISASNYADVKFNYEDRADIIAQYINGGALKISKRLASIDVVVNGNQIKEYDLNYSNKDNFSWLDNVKLNGTNGETFRPIQFENRHTENNEFTDYSRYKRPSGDILGVGATDFTGDGKEDFFVFYGGVSAVFPGPVVTVNYKVGVDLVNGDDKFPTEFELGEIVGDQYLSSGFQNKLVGDFFAEGHSSIVTVGKNGIYANVTFYSVGNFLNQKTNAPVSKGPFSYQVFDGDYTYGSPAPFYVVGNFDGKFGDELIIINNEPKSITDGYQYKARIIKNVEGSSQIIYIKTSSKICKVEAGDYYGQGKDDLFLVLEQSNAVLKNVYIGTDFFDTNMVGGKASSVSFDIDGLTSENIYTIGDVNQDNLPDVVFRKSDNKWYTAINRGSGSFNCELQSFKCDDVSDSGKDHDNVMIVDLNKDGYNDIVIGDEQLSKEYNWLGSFVRYNYDRTDWKYYLYTNNGFQLFKEFSNNERAEGVYYGFGDLNNSGNKEWMKFPSTGGDLQLYTAEDLYNPHRMYKIHNNNTTTILYRNLTEYPCGGITDSNYLPFKTSYVYVVDEYNDGYFRYGMNFEDGVYHKNGRGFIGFLKQSSTNGTTGIGSVTNLKLDAKHAMLLPCSLSVCKNSVVFDLTTYDYSIIDDTNISNHFEVRINSEKKEDKLRSTTISKKYTNYDNFGNPQRLTIDYGAGVSETQVYSYIKKGSWCNNKVNSISVTKGNSKGNSPARISTYGYSDNGNLIKQVQDEGGDNQVVTEYPESEYDGFGNPKQMKVTANGKTRTTTLTYTNSGRFVASKTNVELGKTTSYNYDEVKGVMTNQTDEIGTTTYEYDGFGRLTRTTAPDKVVTASVLQWAGSGGPSGAKYYSYTETSGESSVKIWYDALGREIRRDSYGLNNKLVMVSTDYNTKGQLWRVSEPYFDTPSTYASVTIYDDYGRTSTVTTPVGITQYDYSVPLTTKVTSPSGTVETTINAAGQTVTSKVNEKAVSYVYYPSGLVNTATPEGGVAITMDYDLQGNRTKLVDPDAGTTDTKYNGFGNVVSETRPGKDGTITTTYSYKDNGLLDFKLVKDEKTQYYYNDDRKRLTSIEIAGKNTQTFAYDNFNRITQVDETIGSDKSLSSKTEYDVFGRVSKEIYPSGYFIVNGYDKNGYLISVKDQNGKSIWEAKEANARGQLKRMTQGGRELTCDYDPQGRPISIVSGNIINMGYVFNAQGNLESRTDYINKQSEKFINNTQNCLTNWDVYNNGVLSKSNSASYDPTFGNITAKSDIGYEMKYGENGKPHALTSILGNPALISDETQEIKYTNFQKIASITEKSNSLTLTYGVDEQRRKGVYNINGTITTRCFLGNYEEEIDAAGKIRKLHYINGGNGLAAIYEQNGNTNTLYYTYCDYQGNLLAVTNEAGTVVDSLAYDPWGARRNPANWAEADARTTHLFTRGYTLHEHLDAFGLINMNGRVYDPAIAAFLSPDPFVQAPGDWVYYNRFGYCNFNPLIKTDPSGDIIIESLLIKAGVELAANYLLGGLNNWINNGTSFGDAFGKNATFTSSTYYDVRLGTFGNTFWDNYLMRSAYCGAEKSVELSLRFTRASYQYMADLNWSDVGENALQAIPVYGAARRSGQNLSQGNYLEASFDEAYAFLDLFTLGYGSKYRTAFSCAESLIVRSEAVAAKGSTQLTTRFVSTADGIVDVSPTLNRISSGVKFPHRNDGSIFKNLEGLLPNKPAGYYNEFVHPIPGMKGPGPMRIVTGQGGEMWFTPNHYKTFIPIR
jgi:RHS repeat-associated protein